MPKFRDSDHPVKTSADAEAYLSRLNAFSGVLDGETGRLKAAGGQGLIAPAFLIDKAVTAMEATIADAKAGGSMVESLVRRTGQAKLAGDWNGRAAKIVQGPVAAAPERQPPQRQAPRPSTENGKDG